ncbi:hypothetical protein V6N12_013818 [Hibiscus sabdariffa]|uniref:RNase H type-1 domain-containing protein n=1 Tax=Hibiscus sabdariffa TaxID=183260 RepID=A0ABR1ZB63_9ROSI
MTNLERRRRSVGRHPYCTTCDTHDESTLHVLRDCKFVREVWLYFSPAVYSPTFFTESLQAWLLSNINCHDLVSDYSIPWSTIFVSILWQLWKARNEHVFNSIPQSPTAVWNKGIFWARCDMESFLPPLIRSPDSRSLHWTGPEPGWVCLNVDATVSASTSFGSVAGLLLDQIGSWLSGFQKAIGVLQPLQAELWAVLIGLLFVWDQGFVFVQIQSDCAEAVKLIKADNAYMSPISLVHAIAALRQKAWATKITWIPRTSNFLADMLAKSVDPSSTDFHELDEPPVALMSLLSMDALHLSL